jgi:hypothetical protein
MPQNHKAALGIQMQFDEIPITTYIAELEQAAKLATPGRYQLSNTPSTTNWELIKWVGDSLNTGIRDQVWTVLAVDHPKSVIKDGKLEHGVYVSIAGNGPNSPNNALYQSYLSPDNVLAMIAYIRDLESELRIQRLL